MSSGIVRHLVVDNAAASALLSPRRRDTGRAEVVLAIAAANGRRVAPTAVRGEAGWDRRVPAASDANRLVPEDDHLDRRGADRAVALRRAVPAASLVDAAVAVAAERVGGPGIVEVLTSDPRDLGALAGHLDVRVEIRRL